jgi:hypothetical protein
MPQMDFVYPSSGQEMVNPTENIFQQSPNSIGTLSSPYITSTPTLSPESSQVDPTVSEDIGDKALEDAISGIDVEESTSYAQDINTNLISNPNSIYPGFDPNMLLNWSNGGPALPGYVNIAVNGDHSSENSSVKRMRTMYDPIDLSHSGTTSEPNSMVSVGNSLIYPKMISSDHTVQSQFPMDQVNFSREELLNLSSDQFEEHVRLVSSVRNLTESEKNSIKKQRRLIKNRESAQASRQRKKDYVGDLEKKVDDLMAGLGKLKEIYSSAVTENYQLRNEVEFLSQLLNRIQVY